MSKASLHNFLTKLDKELTKSSVEYRSLQANKRAHIFRFTSTKFAKQIKIQAKAQGIPLSNKDNKFINQESSRLLENLKIKLAKIKAENKKIKSGKTYVRMTFTSSTKVYTKFGDPDSIYHKIYNTYRPLLKTSFGKIQDYLQTQEFVNPETGRKKHKALRTKGGKTREAAGREIQLGHVEGKSVVESFIRDAFEQVLLSEDTYTDAGDASREADIKKQMQALGIDITIIKDSRINTYTVELEAEKDNREGGAQLKAKKAKLQSQIKLALKKLGGIENLKGSDSVKEKLIKKTRREVVEPFKKLSEATVIAKDLKSKDTRSSAQKKAKVRTTKAKRSSQRAGKKALPPQLKAKRQKAKSAASQPLQLLGILNKQLPDTIRKNMREPALVNRTGTFADSVKVVDVIQTPKGYPSYGYTYKRDPYEVFEEGSKGNWANGNRDPRDLIDKSIREIAAEFAMGRFYTRRL